jgi:hypothetical protein
MIYTQLSADYKYDTLADAVYAREVEYFHYDFDRKNFEHLLANATDNEFAANVAERLNDTRKQMGNVEAIMAALKDQIEDQAAYDEAVVQAYLDAHAYIAKRASEYPPITDYIDGVVKGDQAQIDKYIADCLAIKAKYPKGVA